MPSVRVKSRRSAYVLLIFAALLIVLAMFADQPVDVRNALVLLGATGGFCGIFLFVLGGRRPIEADLAAELASHGAPVAGSLVQKLGGRGNASFLPSGSGRDLIQWIPAPAARGMAAGSDGNSIVAYRNGERGIVLAPLAASLLARLKSEYGLVVPVESASLTGAIQEICEDVLPVGRRANVRWDGDRVTVTLDRYLLFPGCTSARGESPDCCTLCPCSICSLIACMVAEGLGREVVVARIDLVAAGRSLRVEMYCIPEERGTRSG